VSIEQYQRPAAPAVREQRRTATELDTWVEVVRDISNLANQIADTEFVPASMRGNAAAVTAAILTGREMGLAPMTSLQHIHIVKGKPGKSAEIMRALVLAAGHQIREVEANDTRVVLEGRRIGEEAWTRVMFTADQAKRAGIQFNGYPEDKLYARATTRLCRRKFADVVGGIVATIEELEDGDYDEERPTPPAQTEAPKRKARRATATRAGVVRAAEESAPPEPDENSGAETYTAPPLPGEDGYDDTTPAPAEPEQAELPVDGPATRSQLNKLHASLNDFGVTERADKLQMVGILARRELASSSDLSKREASQVIDTLAGLADTDDPGRALDALLGQYEAEASDSTEEGS
jgi:hypothetical protein